MAPWLLLLLQLALPVGGMAVKRSGGGKLTELVADHILRDKDRNEFPTVVHGQCHPNKVGRHS